MRSVIRFATAAAIIAWVSFPPAAIGQKAQKPEPPTVREEARVVVVEVPVNVVDRDGKPVEGLKAEDFEVFDDGKPQTITGFEILDQRRALAPPAPGEPPMNPAASRHFLILFDLSFASVQGVVRARHSARDFVVTRMKELDTAAIATYSVETGFRLIVGFTGDRTQLAVAVDTLGLPNLVQRNPDPLALLVTQPNQVSEGPFAITGGDPGSGLDAAMGEALENLQTMFEKSHRAIYRDRVSRMLESFGKLAVSLDAVPGRKHILYLSEGFDSRELSGATSANAGAREAEWAIRGQTWKIDNDSRFGNTDLKNQMTRALALFNRSDCIIHSVDIGGLRTGVAMTANDIPVNGQESLFYMSEETGGQFLKNANEMSSSFDKLLERTGLIYLLAFQPVRVPENGKFHTLKVRVKNKSWQVSARSGYYEPKSQKTLSPIEKTLAQAAAVTAALPKTDIPAWVLAAPLPAVEGLSRVPVIVEIPGDRLLKSHEGSKMNLDIFVYAIDKQGQTRDYLFQPLGIDLSKTEATLAKGGIKYYGVLTLGPGDYTLRTLVRNNENGRFGVTITPVKVSGSTEAVTLPPLFLEEGRQWIMVKGKARSDADSSAEYPFAIAGQSFIPTVLAEMKNGGTIQVCLIAYNFPGESNGLQYTGRVLGVDGQPHGKVDLQLVKASDGERQGARKLLLAFHPTGLDPGRYALVVKLQDPGTGKAAETTSSFDVFQ
jgi:VWFA-related protein